MVLEQYLHISYCFREANQKKGVLSVWTLSVQWVGWGVGGAQPLSLAFVFFSQYLGSYCFMKIALSVHFAGVVGLLAMALWHYVK